MKNLFAAVLILGTFSCKPSTPEAPSPAPINPPDSDLCQNMCDRIGLLGLKCEEGLPVYNSDLPGPKNVPNMSCTDFCKTTQKNGVFMNPRCVRRVTKCSEIETFRKKKPETCL